jgi:diaminopimelate decarboxylase
MKPQRNSQHPNCWGLSIGSEGELKVHDFRVTEFAEEYGTPLHVVNQPRLIVTAERFIGTIRQIYPGKSTVYYAFKCNSVPAVVQYIKKGGLKAEVMTEFELDLAINLGFMGEDIIVNGPCKTNAFLKKCINHQVRLIVVDSIEELYHLHHLTEETEQTVNILLRVNPNYTPKGLNAGSATGNRKSCAFGLDLKSGEVVQTLQRIKNLSTIKFLGFHFHIGTGIRDPKAHANVIRKLFPLFRITQSMGFPINICDIGGGYASFTTRAFTTKELLLQQSTKYFPGKINSHENITLHDFGREITKALLDYFVPDNLPELILEPGRSIASANQFLLLKVHRIKKRQGIGRWIITDGGIGTNSLPTYYEYHEVFLSNQVTRPISGKATIIGPCCFAADIVYKNKPMPDVKSGEVLAIMDTGAYFTSLESNFGFPRPASVTVTEKGHEIIRQRENYEQMTGRDQIKKEGEKNEVFCC